MIDALGDRMKNSYEDRTRYYLPRRTYTIVRLDGKSFSNLTKHMERPYDTRLANAMQVTTQVLCKEIQGCKFGYTQSDEISLLLTDFEDNQTQAYFDSRVFIIPDATEVENYFIWRGNDCIRNSISMLAQSLYSHKELHQKSSDDKQEMCFQKGKNWNDVEDRFKRGSLITKDYFKIKGFGFDGDDKEALRSHWVANAAFDFLKEREKLENLIPKYN